jgi:hypothetical protein
MVDGHKPTYRIFALYGGMDGVGSIMRDEVLRSFPVRILLWFVPLLTLKGLAACMAGVCTEGNEKSPVRCFMCFVLLIEFSFHKGLCRWEGCRLQTFLLPIRLTVSAECSHRRQIWVKQRVAVRFSIRQTLPAEFEDK